MIATVLGAGMMGSEIAIDLASKNYISELAVVDSSNSRLKLVKSKAIARLGSAKSKISLHAADIIRNRQALLSLLKRSDVAVGALPHSVAEFAVNAALESEINYVDLIFAWRAEKDTESIHIKAKDKGITIVPACGLAPGLSNIVAKKAVEEVGGEAEELGIYVGGIPQNPEPPLEYKIVFSAESVLEEYTRDALVLKEGRKAFLPALSEIEDIYFALLPGKRFEAFVTDGLSTLPITIRAKNMIEKTIRWPGHAKKIKLLASLGLLSDEEVKVNHKVTLKPRRLLEKLLLSNLSMSEKDRDMTLLKVVAMSPNSKASYEVVDFYDEVTMTTSMARMTAYPCSAVVQLLLEGKIKESGFIPPEVAVKDSLFQEFIKRLESKGIRFTRV